YGVADALGDLPVYEALLERDLSRGREPPELEGTLLLELTIDDGAPFDGKQVREAGLPPGCVLVLVRRGLEEIVPAANTVLRAGDRVTAVVERRVPGAVSNLRAGTTRVR